MRVQPQLANPMEGSEGSTLVAMSSTERTRARRARLRGADTCNRCGGKPEPGLEWCRECLDAQAQRQRGKTANWQAKGLCTRCGRTAEEGRRRCVPCADYQRTRRAMAKEAKVAEQKRPQWTEQQRAIDAQRLAKRLLARRRRPRVSPIY